MPTKKLTLTVDETVYRSLGARFHDLENKDALVAALAKLALSEWDQWFAARLRPKSIPGLTQERIKMIFNDPDLYGGREVSRGILFNQFNLPYGEASYVERVFAEYDQPKLCAAALEKFVRALGEQLDAWKKDKHRKDDQKFTIEVAKLAQRLLQTIMQRAKLEGVEIAPEERSQAVHGYYNYTFSPKEAEAIVRIGNELLETYKQ